MLVWGEGGCANEGNRFRWFLSEIASHGYVVVAVGPIGPPETEIWKENTPNPPVTPGQPQPPMGRPPATRSAQLIDAIDWARAENERPGSPLHHRLDLSRIAAGGMSCGGAQAIEASADPRVTTTLVMNSGLFPGETTMGGGRPLTKDDLKRLHGPVAYISGDGNDVAYANAEDDYGRIDQVPILRAYRRNTLHAGTYGETDGGDFGKVAVAWLDWSLKGDKAAARLFAGPDCGLCRDPKWVVRTKRIAP